MIDARIDKYFQDHWFKKPGVSVLVDGQYGSTGKGLIAGLIGETCGNRIDLFMNNAGPNSGHTAYHESRKVVLKQLPMAAVIAKKSGKNDNPTVYLNGGTIINESILSDEMKEHLISTVFVHPTAAYIDDLDKTDDAANVSAIASTGQGIGPALIRKLSRKQEVGRWRLFADGDPASSFRVLHRHNHILAEVSQGFSLGINSGFYPHVTTRECTVAQALADAALPPSKVDKVLMTVRTFPIRVGNTEASSGPCYSDQEELDWGTVGVQPEITTVTKRVRRVFSFSKRQFMDAVFANAPDVLFVNFMNYLNNINMDRNTWLLLNILEPYTKVMNRTPDAIFLGYGPRSSDLERYA